MRFVLSSQEVGAGSHANASPNLFSESLFFHLFFFFFKLYVIVLCFLLHASATPAQLLPSCLPSPLGPVDLASSFVCEAPAPVLPPIQHQPESLAGQEHVCLCVCIRRETQMPLFNSRAHFPLGLAKHALALDLTQTQRTSAGEKPDSCTQLF